MNLIKLVISSLKFRLLNSAFNILVLALGIATIIGLLNLNSQLKNRLQADLKGIDLVVGAKGSPLQLVLSSVFHIDIPNGNILLSDAKKLQKHPLVKTAIPISLGDNYNGFRIVGTNYNYIENYNATLKEGRLWQDEMEVVLGALVAKKNNLKVGDKIVGAHGLAMHGEVHDDFPYTVVGILNANNSVLDRLLLANLESVWHVHGHEENEKQDNDKKHKHHEHNHKEIEDSKKEVTALLISYKSPIASALLPREINKNTNLQSASVVFEVARLFKLFGGFSDVVKVFGMLLVIIAGFGFFITLLTFVNEKSYDIALIRCLGATKTKVMQFVLLQGFTLALFGVILGLLFSNIFSFFISTYLSKTKSIEISSFSFGMNEIYVVLAVFVIAIISSIIPAIKAYKLNLTNVLAKGN